MTISFDTLCFMHLVWWRSLNIFFNGLGRVDSQKNQVGSRVNPFLLWVKKKGFKSGIFRVGSGQKILTRIAMSIQHPYYFHPNYRTQTFPYTKVVFGWQHLDLDLKSIVLKCLDLKSLNFKIPCLGLFKQRRIWNFILWIPKFGFGFGFKINKIYFLIIIFLNPSIF